MLGFVLKLLLAQSLNLTDVKSFHPIIFQRICNKKNGNLEIFFYI